MTATIMPDRLERFLNPDFKLRAGTGKGVNSHVDVCIMQAVSWLAGEDHFRDCPDCVPTTIRRYLIRLNDSWLFDDEHRHLLKPYAPRIVGLSKSPNMERARAFVAANYAVRIIAPLWLRWLRRNEWAAELESMPPVIDKKSGIAASDVAKKVRTAADADAAADAAAAADVAADVAAAADAPFCASLRSAALACLDEMIAIKVEETK